MLFFHRLRKDEYVVEVDTDDALHDEILEDVVHHGLKGRRGVRESEEHHKGFEEAAIRTKRCLPLVTFLHANIIVAPSNVELCKVLRATKLVYELRDQRQGVSVLYRDSVQCSIILDESKGTILLLDKEDGGGHQRLRRADSTAAEVLLDELIHLGLFAGGEGVDLAVRRLRARHEFDRMIPHLSIRKTIKGRLRE